MQFLVQVEVHIAGLSNVTTYDYIIIFVFWIKPSAQAYILRILLNAARQLLVPFQIHHFQQARTRHSRSL